MGLHPTEPSSRNLSLIRWNRRSGSSLPNGVLIQGSPAGSSGMPDHDLEQARSEWKCLIGNRCIPVGDTHPTAGRLAAQESSSSIIIRRNRWGWTEVSVCGLKVGFLACAPRLHRARLRRGRQQKRRFYVSHGWHSRAGGEPRAVGSRPHGALRCE